MAGEQTAANWIKELFGPVTEAPVYICSLANERDDPGEPSERHVSTRDLSNVSRFVAKWDRPKRGLFFCVGTIQAGKKRTKENVAEIIGLHADIDFKGIDDAPADVERKLGQLQLSPSAVVRSGNGLHAYWLFNEAMAADEQDRIEAALRLLSDTVGGDPQVCEISRLMRLPGTHNTKQGAFTPVEIISQTTARYELDDLEEWLSETSPIILRKVRPQVTPTDNPFLIAAQRLGFKPSIDVEKRLQGMTYMGGGDSAIHTTQLAVSASLLNAGQPLSDVVDIVLSATRAAAGEYGARWNWRREERAIERMCQAWMKKHPPEARPKSLSSAAVPSSPSENMATVTNLAEARKAKAKPKKDGASLHLVLGEAVLEAIKQREEKLIFTRQSAWRYSDGVWSMEIDGLQAWLNVEIETACRALNIESTNKIIAETRQWIVRHPDLWRDHVEWDWHKKVPTKSGLVDPASGELIPLSPDHYCTWRIECEYDPKATCPWWLTMISDFFGDRTPDQRKRLIEVVQECLGAAMLDSKPRSLSKALILQGGSNFGKSGILEVLGGLFGQDQIATPLDALEGAHGLMAFTRRLPWVLHEAFDQRKWHFSSVVKAIVTGEPVNINIKNGPMLSTRVRSPIFWGTNHPPQFKEATKAIVNRIIVIECRREFVEGEAPIGAAAEARSLGYDKPSSLVLDNEMPGLLNWAIAGLKRALERGYIELTDEIAAAAESIRRDSNLVAGFLEECVEFKPDRMLSVPDFCAAFSVWWLENKGEDRRLPSNESIGRALVAMSDRRIAVNPTELRDKRRRYYGGIVLNEQGMEYRKRAFDANVFQGKTTSVSDRDAIVNEPIPENWRAKPSIIAMTVAQNGPKNRTVTYCHQSQELSSNDSSELSPRNLSPTDPSPTEATVPQSHPLF